MRNFSYLCNKNDGYKAIYKGCGGAVDAAH